MIKVPQCIYGKYFFSHEVPMCIRHNSSEGLNLTTRNLNGTVAQTYQY